MCLHFPEVTKLTNVHQILTSTFRPSLWNMMTYAINTRATCCLRVISLFYSTFRGSLGSSRQGATSKTFDCLLTWSRLFLSPSRSKRSPIPRRCRMPSPNTRAGEATTEPEERPLRTSSRARYLHVEDVWSGISPCIYFLVASSQYCNISHFRGENAAKLPSVTSEMATEEAAFDLSQLVDILWAAISHKSPCRPRTTRRACRTSVPLLCIKDETRWQITVARGALNPPIVSQSCCPVIYSRRLASTSVFGLFNASFTESITFSHKNMTPRARAHALMRQRETGQAGTRESEADGDGWRNGRMSSVRSIRRACSLHKRTGRRLEEIPVTSAADVGRSRWISRRGIFPDRRR